MMKRLLTTTMLASAVTFGGGLAAQAADITISANAETRYQSWSDDEDNTGGSNDSRITHESHIAIAAESTSDSGLTYGTWFRIEAEKGNGGGSNLKEDTSYLYVSGDFGRIVTGGFSAGDTYYSSVLDSVTNDELVSGVGDVNYDNFDATTWLAGDEEITYHTPDLGGFKGGFTMGDAGSDSKADVRELGLQYSGSLMDGSFGVKYAVGQADRAGTTGNEVAATSFGVTLNTGAFGFSVSRNTREDEDENSVKQKDLVNTGFGASYKASDQLKLSLARASFEDDHDAAETKEGDVTALSADYTIAPGLSTGLTYTTWEGQDTEASVKDPDGNQSGTSTVLYLKVAF